MLQLALIARLRGHPQGPPNYSLHRAAKTLRPALIAGNSYVSEMQLRFVTVTSNGPVCPMRHNKTIRAVRDTNGLASYLIKSYDDTDGTLTDFE